MATRKAAASTKKATAKKPAPKATSSQTTVRTLRADSKPTTTRSAAVERPVRERRSLVMPDNLLSIIIAEILGTMILSLVTLFVAKEMGALYAGLTVVVLALAIGRISGAHINPAVTFGMAVIRRTRLMLVPFYWIAQFLGAMLAVVTVQLIAPASLAIDFSNFWTFSWPIFGLEMIGTAIFLFGLTLIQSRSDIADGLRAVGVGLSLTIGLVVASTLLTAAQNDSMTKYQKEASAVSAGKEQPPIPHAFHVNGAMLNPAVALVNTERSDAQITGSQATKTEAARTRLTAEVILGSLVGGGVGAGIAALIDRRRRIV